MPFGDPSCADRLWADGQAAAAHPPWDPSLWLHAVCRADEGTRGSNRRAFWPRRSRNASLTARSEYRVLVFDPAACVRLAGLWCPGVPADQGPPPYEVRAASVVSLRAELAETRAELDRARERIAELAARLRQTPRNSSKPASGEGLAKRAPRLRRSCLRRYPQSQAPPLLAKRATASLTRRADRQRALAPTLTVKHLADQGQVAEHRGYHNRVERRERSQAGGGTAGIVLGQH